MVFGVQWVISITPVDAMPRRPVSRELFSTAVFIRAKGKRLEGKEGSSYGRTVSDY